MSPAEVAEFLGLDFDYDPEGAIEKIDAIYDRLGELRAYYQARKENDK